MVNVVFHIPIRDGWHGESWLLETVYDLDFLPDEGDVFHPLKNDEESGLSMEVRQRYWNEHGKVQIETHTYVVDPPQDLDGHFHTVYRQWNSGLDGDLVGLLMDNGWWAYGKTPEDRQDQILDEAIELVKKRLEAGLASPDMIRRFLGFGESNG